jgi:hypothetical protein
VATLLEARQQRRGPHEGLEEDARDRQHRPPGRLVDGRLAPEHRAVAQLSAQ